jgi:glycosyltransferase
MNKGINRASGDVIGILNSDDILLPGALAAVASAFASGDADLAFGDVIAEGEFGTRLINATERGMDRAMTIPHPGCFVRADAYDRWGVFDTQYRIAADYELLLRFVSGQAKLVNLHRPVALFREGGVSSRSFAVALEAYRIQRLYYGRAHALRRGLTRISATVLLVVRKTVGTLVLGKERYGRIRSVLRNRSIPKVQ